MPPPLVQHPYVITVASSEGIRVTHRLSSLLVTQNKSLSPPCTDGAGISTSSST